MARFDKFALDLSNLATELRLLIRDLAYLPHLNPVWESLTQILVLFRSRQF